MSNPEAKLGKSLDAIIEENRAKTLGASKRSGPARAPTMTGAAATGTSSSKPRGGGSRVAPRASRLTGVAGLRGGSTKGAGDKAVVVGNTRYVKAQVPGVSNAGVTKAGGGGRRKRTGGGGAAAAFAHDDRTGMGGFADDSYAMGNAGSGMGSVARMGGRLQRRSAAGAGDRWQHDMFDPRETPVTPRRAGRLAGAPPSLPTRVLVQNLDFKVTKQDLEELFMPIGELLSAAIDYDRSDRPTGTGQVVFRDRKDAEQALATYNGVKLDNRPLQLTIDDARVQILSSGKSVQFPAGAPARGGGLGSRVTQQAPRQLAASRTGGRGRGGGRLRSVVGAGRAAQALDDADYMQE
uniref:RRM domain-containing protein n=1 Tax=Dunaliella tertiolecta TaxID=3047 RepID=A0A6S8M0K3_DUNTE